MQYDYSEQPKLTGTEDVQAPEQSQPEKFQQNLTKIYSVIKKTKKENLDLV